MAAPKNRGLGKGLEALFGDIEIDRFEKEEKEIPNKERKKEDKGIDDNSIIFIDINDIGPNSNQPRKTFNQEKIEELANSIKEHGIIQPIVVRKHENGYEIVAGERRWRAARVAELKKIPCLIKELTDEQNMLLAIIENMQREDLNPIEEADAIHQMIENYGLTQEEVSKSLGKSRPYITNALRLLRLPEEIRNMVTEGTLSSGHARALVTIPDQKLQVALAARVVREGLSVREIEKLAANNGMGKPKPIPRKKARNVEILKVEEELKDILGTKVNLNDKGKRGTIEIEYYSRDELERLLDLIKGIK